MDYLAPTTIEEAVGALASTSDSRVFAGATDLIPQIRSGRPEPGLLVDLKRIDRLTAVTEGDTSWMVGAAAPTSGLTENIAFSRQFPGLSEAAGLIGSDQIQNRSSLGGNLCNASPAADSVPAMIVNGARAIIATPDGTRTFQKVDGVYNADPEGNADAVRYKRLTHDEAVRENLQFMDQAAIAVCRENDLPIIVFDMTAPGNIRKVVAGEAIGTTVSG